MLLGGGSPGDDNGPARDGRPRRAPCAMAAIIPETGCQAVPGPYRPVLHGPWGSRAGRFPAARSPSVGTPPIRRRSARTESSRDVRPGRGEPIETETRQGPFRTAAVVIATWAVVDAGRNPSR